jgi:hypothetical protein
MLVGDVPTGQSDPPRDRLGMLQRAIVERQGELQRTADTLASHAQTFWRLSTTAKVSLVLLGALSATKATTDQVVGSTSTGGLITYTVLGVLTATIAGVQAAMHFDARSTGLTALAAESQALLRNVDSDWYKKVGVVSPDQDRIAAALEILALQDDTLASVQQRAAEAGVNITIKVRELSRLEDEKQPYRA